MSLQQILHPDDWEDLQYVRYNTRGIIEKLLELGHHFKSHPEQLSKHLSEGGYFMFDWENQHWTAEEIEAIQDQDAKKIAKLYYGIMHDADSVLITKDGNPNYLAFRELEKFDFNVRKGEGDSFGWLSGVIYGMGLKIAFG